MHIYSLLQLYSHVQVEQLGGPPQEDWRTGQEELESWPN